MKKLFGIVLLVACLIACSQKDHSQTDPPPAVTVIEHSPLPAPETPKAPFVGSTWSLVVPDGFTKEDAGKSSIEGMFTNRDKKTLITLVKEVWAGTPQDYAFLGMLALKQNGIATTNPSQLTLNGQVTTLIEGTVDSDDIHLWVWMTVKDGYGYTLSCGGEGDPGQYRALCTGLYESFKIN